MSIWFKPSEQSYLGDLPIIYTWNALTQTEICYSRYSSIVSYQTRKTIVHLFRTIRTVMLEKFANIIYIKCFNTNRNLLQWIQPYLQLSSVIVVCHTSINLSTLSRNTSPSLISWWLSRHGNT